MEYPIIADLNRELAIRLSMLDPEEKDKAGLPLTARGECHYVLDKWSVVGPVSCEGYLWGLCSDCAKQPPALLTLNECLKQSIIDVISTYASCRSVVCLLLLCQLSSIPLSFSLE